MKHPYLVAALVSLLGAFAGAIGCGGGTEEVNSRVSPVSGGQRGETCLARNDCESGLACINNICSKNDFPTLESSPKQCDIVECEETADCCGDKATEIPDKCKGRDEICNQPYLDGCLENSCTSDSECDGGGSCSPGSCSNGLGACEVAGDCEDTCIDTNDDDIVDTCSVSSLSCASDISCYGAGFCNNRFCDCTNPLYDPTNDICTDEECEDVCTLRCESERCVEDTSCESDSDCFTGLDICEEGKCVECVEDEDCDTDNDESCVNNACKRACEYDEECPLFHACDDGECVEKGCTSDVECVLAASNGGEDARLAECRPDPNNPDVNRCQVPCENDGSCGQFSLCEEGYCKFIGCDSDTECRTYFGIANQEIDEDKPYVSRAVCRE